MQPMFELPPDFVRGTTYQEYPYLFSDNAILGRRQVAERAGKSYSTVTYHLERAVSAGLLNKAYDYIDGQPGWVYALPAIMPRMWSISEMDRELKSSPADSDNNFENERNW